jgi:PKD repeat protein
MKKFTLHCLLFIFTLSIATVMSYSQVNSGGVPMSTLTGITSVFAEKTMPPVDRERLLEEDRANLLEPTMPFRYGTVVNVNYALNNSGTWETFSDGSRLWRLAITSPNAMSVNLYFGDFYIPEGGQFFIYNEDRSTVLGAFTYLNNTKDNKFATAPTPGETTILEYYEPVQVKGKSRISVSQVVHAYRDIFGFLSTDELQCNININCAIGAPWVEQKRSVTRITFTQGSGSFLCTGSLVNNVLQDRKLYYLTAEHCSPDNHSSMVFYFNYESPTCVGTNGSLNQTISGATLLASSYATDMRLVELNGTLPSSYNAYFNGWDKSGAQPTNEVAIHHPGGANKKISIDNHPSPTSNGFGGRLPGGFWQVVWDEGMTEGGSSGCPLYDQNKRVIGQNLGGTASQCENPQNVQKVFGKFSESWSYGGSPSSQLKDWLDPGNTNVNTLNGIDAVTGMAPVSNFTSNVQNLPISGGSVNFIDLTSNGPTSWSWSFPGGTPSSSTSQNPTNISYSATGAYTVTLTTTNVNGSNVKTFVNYIKVAGVPLSPFTLVSPPNGTTLTVSNGDPSTVLFNWLRSSSSSTVKYIFKIKKIATSVEYSYNADNNGLDSLINVRKNFLDSLAGIMGFTGDSVRCTWRAAATNGVDTLHTGSAFLITLKSTTIGITPIGNVVPESFKLFNNYPNPFNPVTNITFDVPKSQFVKIRVYDAQGREIAVLVNQNLNAGRYNVDFDGANLASGIYFYALESQDFYKVNKMVLVK